MTKFYKKLFCLLCSFLFLLATPVLAIEPVDVSVNLETNRVIKVKVSPKDGAPALATDTFEFNSSTSIPFKFNRPGKYHYELSVISPDTKDYKYDRDTKYDISIYVFRDENATSAEKAVSTSIEITKVGSTTKLDKIKFEVKDAPKTTPTPTPTAKPASVTPTPTATTNTTTVAQQNTTSSTNVRTGDSPAGLLYLSATIASLLLVSILIRKKVSVQ